ncbi:MAG: metallophosphoesterase [Verrucomicrobia bacterium]|nr:metallophosphoesterase [Verrucomicrobiota bacterium]
MTDSHPSDVLWLSDLHLNLVEASLVQEIVEKVAATNPRAVLITGDISDGLRVTKHLRALSRAVNAPILFVCGNHDYYHSSFAQVTKRVQALCERNRNLVWLTRMGHVELSATTCVVGHDALGDGRTDSDMDISDFLWIKDLAELSHEDRFKLLRARGEECRKHLAEVLPPALARYEHVIVLLHAPPFAEASRFRGRPSSRESLAHYLCASAGEAMWQASIAHPRADIHVLCGHCHYGADVAIPGTNIHVSVNGSDYHHPEFRLLSLR